MVAVPVDPDDRPALTKRFQDEYPTAIWDEATQHYPKRQAQRHITAKMVDEAVASANAEVFERYEGTETFNLLGVSDSGVSIHVRMSLGNPAILRTLYDPSVDDKGRWEADLKTRRRYSREQDNDL